jgi:hypothetical protein
MLILPAQKKDGVYQARYTSNVVFLIDNHRKHLVGAEYEGDSITEVIRIAVLNAKVKQMRLTLAGQMNSRVSPLRSV